MAITDKSILQAAETCGFVDPITGLPPRGEVDLSALLSIFHQRGQINWSLVKLRDENCKLTGEFASEIFSQAGALCAEYPLFLDPAIHEDSRGGMRPDFMYISNDLNIVALIENNIGAGDTHKADKYGGQLGRNIQYLLESSSAARYVILLTSEFFLKKNPPWYATEFQESVRLQNSAQIVKSRILVWEEILQAFTSPVLPPNYSSKPTANAAA